METETIKDLIGVVLDAVTVSDDKDEILFLLNDGRKFKFHHYQDCCENVDVDDVSGDWDDIIGSPIIVAEERTETGDLDDYESYTWTFYTFRTLKGSVDVKWIGVSNGYYSESVDYHFV